MHPLPRKPSQHIRVSYLFISYRCRPYLQNVDVLALVISSKKTLRRSNIQPRAAQSHLELLPARHRRMVVLMTDAMEQRVEVGALGELHQEVETEVLVGQNAIESAATVEAEVELRYQRALRQVPALHCKVVLE